MKNLIKYYYNLRIKNFKKVERRFVFQANGKEYEFIPFYGNVNVLYKNYLRVLNKNKYCHEIVFNKDKNIITFYENIPYLLLKKNLVLNNKVNLDEIIIYDPPIYNKAKLEWKRLWKEKIDYYEYQMGQISHKYKILKNSFDYYIGLSENALCLLNYINENNIRFYICHRRIMVGNELDELFNPVNFVEDSLLRDIGEFIKISYFTRGVEITSIYDCIDKLNLNDTEAILLLARLMYPSYYFDMYDQIIQEKLCEEKIQIYLKKNASYETFLKKIYIFIKTKFRIPEIEWLEN